MTHCRKSRSMVMGKTIYCKHKVDYYIKIRMYEALKLYLPRTISLDFKFSICVAKYMIATYIYAIPLIRRLA